MLRLREVEPSQDGHGLFTSDLSVNESLLVRQAGFRPRGLVFDSSVYHIGLRGRSWRKNQELAKLSHAMYSAREPAMERMETEATVMWGGWHRRSAAGCLLPPMGKALHRVVAIGTAVSAETCPGSRRNDQGAPSTSDLSGQDFWTLVQTGYAPLVMVMGNSHFWASTSSNSSRSAPLSGPSAPTTASPNPRLSSPSTNSRPA